ncbi:hypothetical protein KL905_003290 [Ogataea polymorpha]|nr:hypothetical protein KL908_003327 [Ogataea polymorpha]KAG7920656.1 hypothetical protein KL905_003290 [Ogataea polymorpha]
MAFAKGFLRFAGVTGVSMVSFGAGVSVFGRAWPVLKEKDKQLANERSLQSLDFIKNSTLYKQLAADKSFELLSGSQLIPEAHRQYHVGQGLLNSPNHMTTDPIIFLNRDQGKMYCIAHLGAQTVGTDRKIHNGIIATIIDEGLCLCGFSKLPSKRGVTAQLKLDFFQKAPPESTVVLEAQVQEFRGRKCVITGTVKTLERSPIKVADGYCVLVEPVWFKYLNWVPVFA